MTLVASWIKYELPDKNPTIWTVSDSKISIDEDTLTLCGSKVLELHIKCKSLKGLPPRNIYHTSSIGFAYAGSTLSALNVYATLDSILSNLGGNETKNNLPDYLAIIDKAQRILKLYLAKEQMCEICLFGFCPKNKQPFISAIRPRLTDNGLEFEVENTFGENENLIVTLLGDKKEVFANQIIAMGNEYSQDQYAYWELPLPILYTMMKDSNYTTIGGGLQLATVDAKNFTFASLNLQSVKNESDTMKFRNLDVFEDIGIQIGDCYFAMDSISY
ncbi:MAG: hypothetical protein Q8R82_14260 [Hyphomonadaceae bacterium]|nr:hypothetical protein [Hyphomonadaceae bacterium]